METQLNDVLQIVANALDIKIEKVPSIIVKEGNRKDDHTCEYMELKVTICNLRRLCSANRFSTFFRAKSVSALKTQRKGPNCGKQGAQIFWK